MDCAGIVGDVELGVELESLAVKKGYWRSGVTSDKIYKCEIESACAGGKNASCNTGYVGPLCSTCVVNFFYSPDATACDACGSASSHVSSITMSVVFFVLVVGSLAGLGWIYQNKDRFVRLNKNFSKMQVIYDSIEVKFKVSFIIKRAQ